MLIFLYGQDSYSSQKKLEELILKYKEANKNGLSLIIFDGDNLDFSDLKREFETTSMFKENKLLVIKNIFSNKKFKEDFLKSADNFFLSENSVIFCETGEVDKRESFFKFLSKKSKVQEFCPLVGRELDVWLEKEFLNCKARIEPVAKSRLLDFVGNDLWQLANEVIKLVNYAKGRKITPEDVELLIKPKIENDIFETISSLAEKRKDKALYLIHKHLEKGDSPLYLLSMIVFQFRNLLAIKDLLEKKVPYYEISKRSGLHPFVVKKSYSQCREFSFEELKKIYQKIFRIDFEIKTGKVNPEAGLELLIAEI